MIGPLAEALVADWQERNGPTCSIPLDHPFIAELGTWRRHDGRHRPLSTSQGLRIISELFQACERAIEPEAAGGDLAPQAIALMESQLYRNWSVTELAERLGVSREYLTRRFRQETGSTPARFGLKLRLQAAGRCLVSEATPMTDVASAHGFGSVAHFSRAFRACYGLTPGACRRSGNLPTG
jgi:AraC-like DNA-binding protein